MDLLRVRRPAYAKNGKSLDFEINFAVDQESGAKQQYTNIAVMCRKGLQRNSMYHVRTTKMPSK